MKMLKELLSHLHFTGCGLLGGLLLLTTATLADQPDPLDIWETRYQVEYDIMRDVDYYKGQFVATGSWGGIPLLLTSTNGTAWTRHEIPLSTNSPRFTFPATIVSGSGTLLIGGTGGLILTSKDAVHWDDHIAGDGRFNASDSAFGNGKFVIGGGSMTPFFPIQFAYTSTYENGRLGFERQGAGNGVVFGRTNFVSILANQVLTSADGSHWEPVTVLDPVYFSAVGYGNGIFLLFGENGAAFTSSDGGSTWHKQNSGTTNRILTVGYGGGYFVAAGDNGTLLTSPDAITWKKRTLPASFSSMQFTGLTFGNDTFMLAGVTASRNDPSVLLQSGRLPSARTGPQLSQPLIETNQFSFTLWWPTNEVVRLQASSNLVDWHDVKTITTSPQAAAWISEQRLTNTPSRFYRVINE